MKLVDLNKTYIKNKKRIEIFSNLNCEFKKGKFYSIIGESGSGKSTLINILGLLDTFDSGKYIIDKKEINDFSDKNLSETRLNKIGLVFQDYYLNPRLTAYENVLLAARLNKKLTDEEMNNNIIKYFKKMNIEDRLNHYPNELSGGEQQRVCIVRALINEPDYILADEPTGSLDPKNSKIIMDILKKLVKEGKTIIMVTHDMNLIKESDVVYEIKNKTLMEKK